MTTPTPIEDPISSREIAQHLRRMMDLAGSSPELLAAHLGCSRQTIDAWLYGRHLEKVATVLGAFEALGCRIVITCPKRYTKRPK